MATKKLCIGMFGGGTVGGGVYEILNTKRAYFQSIGADVFIKKICVRDAAKKRDFDILPETAVVTNYNEIMDDDEINVILELMGGVTDAKDIVMRALQTGKHVITANKALVAAHLAELENEVSKYPNVSLGYEAAVCGGIPIIHTLGSAYAGDNITQVAGILNGTTNFMLSKMEGEGADYAEVLREAQALGFAEADPTADVEGHDVRSKLAILSRLAFGATLQPEQINTTGITRITKADFEYAAQLKSTVKLLGVARRTSSSSSSSGGDSLSVFVSPCIVPLDNVVASVGGATNIVDIISTQLSSASYVGQGAGRYPTANSVVSDVLMLARDLLPPAFPAASQVSLQPDYEARFYIRLIISDQVGIIAAVGAECGRQGVSIFSVLQTPIVDPARVEFVLTTDTARRSQVDAVCKSLHALPWSLEEPLALPFL